jgi:DNA invertase Pin-like site-specific DNA recombinase
MSSDDQDKSVPDQRDAVAAWAAKNNYCILWEYIDEGISGDETHKRVAFKQLVEEAANGQFCAVVSWDQDRFGRFDLLEAGWWVKPLRDARVHLATVGQGVYDWDSSTGRLMFGIQAEAKHQFLQDLSRNSTRGKISKAHLGE